MTVQITIYANLQIQIQMKKQVLSFSSGCVINLDQLDDFPDYYDVITNLTEQIKQNKVGSKTITDFLDGDLEDVQHIPQFKQLMDLLIIKFKEVIQNIAKNKQEESKMLKGKFIIFLLKIVKNYFTSFSIEEEEATPIIQILKKQIGGYPQYFCDFWLAIATFAPYVEKHEELVDLYLDVVNENLLFGSEEMITSYMKSTDKILRFRSFRAAFVNRLGKNNNKQSDGRFQYLKFKLSLHENKTQSMLIKEAYLRFCKGVAENRDSQFLSNYQKLWAGKLEI